MRPLRRVAPWTGVFCQGFRLGAFNGTWYGHGLGTNPDLIADVVSKPMVALDISRIGYLHGHRHECEMDERKICKGNAWVAIGHS